MEIGGGADRACSEDKNVADGRGTTVGAGGGRSGLVKGAKMTNDTSGRVPEASRLSQDTLDLSRMPFLTGLPRPDPLTRFPEGRFNGSERLPVRTRISSHRGARARSLRNAAWEYPSSRGRATDAREKESPLTVYNP
ncbi:hypothetical protein CRG98_028635 [Punica granatum]|uniref:Uncharacterized protein n=1 Tax=Punica granatum TaxID=22663 RepID=A0A2I0J4J8_PUNGR|nr:hypothetical protein CRG98_028635 [Punica granatum]